MVYPIDAASTLPIFSGSVREHDARGARLNQRRLTTPCFGAEDLNEAMRESSPPRCLGSWRAPGWDILEIITSSSPDGITIQDATGTLIYANDAAARMSGFASGQDMQRASTDEIVGRFELLDEDGLPLPVGQLPGRRALTGEREPEAVVRFRRRSGGGERWAIVRATPLLDARGEVRHVVNVFVDITEDRARLQAQSFLVSATHELSRSLNWEATIQRVARLAVPDLADWCAVDVLEADGSLSLIAVAHVDPAKVEWARELRRRFPTEPDDTSGVAHVVRTGESELIPEITQELIDAANITDPELLEVVERLQLSSVMSIPLIARGTDPRSTDDGVGGVRETLHRRRPPTR